MGVHQLPLRTLRRSRGELCAGLVLASFCLCRHRAKRPFQPETGCELFPVRPVTESQPRGEGWCVTASTVLGCNDKGCGQVSWGDSFMGLPPF